MKKFFLIVSLVFCALNVLGQEKSDLMKLAETENSFARIVDEKGIKEGFLAFLADDGLLFRPTAVNGKESWRARPATPASLSWYPVFIAVSSNGVLGYTTGAGEYRPSGKTDRNVYYSDYLTVWQRQPNGNYKALLDIGVSHEKPTATDKNWKSPENTGKNSTENKPPASDSANLFFDTATAKGLDKAYKMFAAEKVRFLREGKQPILGKANALALSKKDKSKIIFGKNMTLQSAGDLAYSVTTYQLKNGEKIVEKGNAVEVWKFFGESWQIVMDVFAPIPEK